MSEGDENQPGQGETEGCVHDLRRVRYIGERAAYNNPRRMAADLRKLADAVERGEMDGVAWASVGDEQAGSWLAFAHGDDEPPSPGMVSLLIAQCADLQHRLLRLNDALLGDFEEDDED